MTNVNELTPEQQKELLAKLMEENAALKAKALDKVGIKATEKGGVSVYGLQRFPVTLFPAQWVALDARMGEVLAFIQANAEKLSWKDETGKQTDLNYILDALTK